MELNNDIILPLKNQIFFLGGFQMLKKFFIAAVMSVFVLVGGQVNAMPYSEMFLGGFTVGSSYSAMKRVYGEPVQNEGHSEANYSSHYGDTVKINFNNIVNRIQGIRVTANNGWKTPSGLAVGDNISKALDICGEPDYKKVGKYKTAYCYFHNMGGKYLDEYGFFILFNNESGKILRLELDGGNTMSGFEQDYQYYMKRMVE